MSRRRPSWWWPALFAVLPVALAPPLPAMEAGFASVDLTPALDDDRPVWLAGYMPGRRATGVHDPIVARCVVLSDGQVKVAVISVDLIGMQYPLVQQLRRRLPEFDHVTVTSTHNHEGPDVIGLWGPSFLRRGVDDDYLDLLLHRLEEVVHAADAVRKPVSAGYGTAEDPDLVRDSRLPEVKDATLRAVVLSDDRGELAGLLVQWNCHPEALGARNTLLTADFPAATVGALEQAYGCPVVYLTGAVGGLMAPPRDRIRDGDGELLHEGDFEYARRYGEAVARLAAKAVDGAEPIALEPIHVAATPIALPVTNPWYRAARLTGVVRREGYAWTGDPEEIGPVLRMWQARTPSAILTEVGYLRLGELHVANIPGEIYPELVYGRVPEPAETGADFPEASREPSITEIFSGEPFLLLGLANDEVGYLIPERQWDQRPPYAYGRTRPPYGEIHSCGPQGARMVLEALGRRVESLRLPPAEAPGG